jgi:hypothetical protein
MKRALFRLLAGLVSLSLAACTLSLLTTPTTAATATLSLPTLTPFTAPTETPQTTDTPTPEPTVTPEPLGGSEVAYLWNSANHLLPSLPEGVTDILSHPSSPDVWKQPTGLFYSDGTPLPWGKFFVDTFGPTRVNFPVLVRGVIEIPNPRVQEGGTTILPVFEVSAQGGSNFIIPYTVDNKWSTMGSMNISYLTNGIPLTWESSLDHPVDSTVFYAGMKFTGVYNSREIADVLQQYMGSIIIVTFSIDERDHSTPALKQVVQGKLIDQGGSHSVENFLFLGGLILPQK